MARKTKAERAAEEAAQLAAGWQVFAAEYNKRLTMLVYNFGRLGHAQFTVQFLPESQEFALQTDQDWHSEWKFPLVLPELRDNDFMWNMSDAERAVERHLEEVARAEEQERKRVSALNKLSPEERALLGL